MAHAPHRSACWPCQRLLQTVGESSASSTGMAALLAQERWTVFCIFAQFSSFFKKKYALMVTWCVFLGCVRAAECLPSPFACDGQL